MNKMFFFINQVLISVVEEIANLNRAISVFLVLVRRLLLVIVRAELVLLINISIRFCILVLRVVLLFF